MGYRGFAKFSLGRAAPEHSVMKLLGSESVQRAILGGSEALGALALDRDAHRFEYIGTRTWAMQYLWSFGGTIPGGTSEIQRNIIAERVLGLPRV
jgi:alkylation response protein AidB-like acyl-CoA dehydrogenase